jgi:hypothetical protein
MDALLARWAHANSLCVQRTEFDRAGAIQGRSTNVHVAVAAGGAASDPIVDTAAR